MQLGWPGSDPERLVKRRQGGQGDGRGGVQAGSVQRGWQQRQVTGREQARGDDGFGGSEDEARGFV